MAFSPDPVKLFGFHGVWLFLGLSNFGCVGADGNPPVHVNGRIAIRPYIISHPDFERAAFLCLKALAYAALFRNILPLEVCSFLF